MTLDIRIMVNWQLLKKVSADKCRMTVSRAQAYNSLRYWGDVCSKVIRGPVIGSKIDPGNAFLCKHHLSWTVSLKHISTRKVFIFKKLTKEEIWRCQLKIC